MQVWVFISAIAGFTGVAFGAFGAHGLRSKLSPDLLTIFETGCRYQMYHALALLAVAWLCDRGINVWATRAGWAFSIGILIFSGSLYALALTDIRTLGAITPIGGVAFLLGWLFLARAAWS